MQSRRLKEGELKEACLLIHKAQASWSSASEESLREISQRIEESIDNSSSSCFATPEASSAGPTEETGLTY